MSNHMYIWIFDCLDQAVSVVFFLTASHVHAGDHDIKLAQKVIIKIQPLLEDIHLDTGEQPKIVALIL